MKNPWIASGLSLVLPGLGQLFLGDRAKGWTLLSMAGGVALSLLLSHTPVGLFLMGGIYLTVLIPASLDAFQVASGRPRVFSGDSILYVIVMLLMIGPFALPLLWQSQKFAKAGKIAWTVAVILMAFLAIWVLTFMASFLDPFLNQAAGS